MKRNLLTLSIAIPISLVIGMSCALDPPPAPPGAGGAGGSAGAGTGGSTTGTGGATTGTGGATTGTGGATTGTGGATTGTGGAAGTGGATTGTGGATTGTGGATTGTGGAAGTGGATTGTGGAAGTGGATTGGAAGTAGATTGMSGAGGAVDAGRAGGAGSGGQAGGGAGSDAGSGGAAPDAGNLISVVGTFDGYMFIAPCNGGETGYDCLNSGCTGTTKTYTQAFQIGGQTGTFYNVNFAVAGITEAKLYSGGMRRAGTTPLARDNAGGDAWYQGGTVPNSTYNSYELHVTPAVTGAPNDYYLNAAATSSEEDHLGFVLNYNATIKVPAGGTITFRTYDSNCRQIMNCGNFTASCPMPRTLPTTSWAPPPPTTFMQPYNGQFVHFDVTSVTVAP